MMYSVLLGSFVLVAAIPVERLVRTSSGPTRRVWMGAFLLSVLLPAAGVLVKDTAAAVEVGGQLVLSSPSAGLIMSGVDVLAVLDRLLLSGWALLSTLLVSVLFGGLAATAVRARRWRVTELDGVPVLQSRDVGPAVVGVLRHRIVVPAWACALEPDQRAMLLRHEEEHVRAGDPKLLFATAMLLALFPWNPVLWILAARVRLSVETDCDGRVLAGPARRDLRGYAELLLSVGAHRSRAAYGVGFSLGRPFLEQRIDRMTEPRVRLGPWHAALVVVGVLGVSAAAWALPQPVRAAKIGDAVKTCPVNTAKVSARLVDGLDWST
jgi:hypothetical protein